MWVKKSYNQIKILEIFCSLSKALWKKKPICLLKNCGHEVLASVLYYWN